MSESNPPAPPPEIAGLLVRASPEYQVIYSNFFRYRLAPYDIALTFSTIADPGGGVGPATLTDRVQIVMAYGQIKSLMEYLSLIVRTYERDVATINTPGSAPQESEVMNQIATLQALGMH
jgi:hypothetical protein